MLAILVGKLQYVQDHYFQDTFKLVVKLNQSFLCLL